MTVLTERESTRDEVLAQRGTPVEQARPRVRENLVGPPRRRRPAAAPRLVAVVGCAPRRRPSLPLAWLLVAAVLVGAAVFGLGALANATSGAESVPSRTEVVRIEPGESLWDLAERMAPGSEPSAVVSRIKELNAPLDGVLRPGQPLTVPSEG